MDYWKREAAKWVSWTVLGGGLISACLLAFIYQSEKDLEYYNLSPDEEAILLELETFKT